MFAINGLEKLVRNNHLSLLQKLVNYGQKSFITLCPGVLHGAQREGVPQGGQRPVPGYPEERLSGQAVEMSVITRGLHYKNFSHL